MSADEELVTVVTDEGVRVVYKQEHGNSALIIYSSGSYSLPSALGAVKQTATRSGRPASRVRYRPAQGKAPACIILEYAGGLSDEESLSFATAFVLAVKLRG